MIHFDWEATLTVFNMIVVVGLIQTSLGYFLRSSLRVALTLSIYFKLDGDGDEMAALAASKLCVVTKVIILSVSVLFFR